VTRQDKEQLKFLPWQNRRNQNQWFGEQGQGFNEKGERIWIPSGQVLENPPEIESEQKKVWILTRSVVENNPGSESEQEKVQILTSSLVEKNPGVRLLNTQVWMLQNQVPENHKGFREQTWCFKEHGSKREFLILVRWQEREAFAGQKVTNKMTQGTPRGFTATFKTSQRTSRGFIMTIEMSQRTIKEQRL
jgi:hypothetical protein